MMTNLLDSQGYDYEFVPSLDPKYECPICHLCLRDAVQTSCGHRFCHQCIMKWLQRNKESLCPADNAHNITEKDIFKDVGTQREILTLRVKCAYAENGCPTVMELGHIHHHEKVCVFPVVFCPFNCGKKIYHKDIESHKKDCIFYPVQCSYCGENLQRADIKEHNNRCPLVTVKCDFCHVFLDRKDVENHVTLECPNVVISCDFSNLGCSARMERRFLFEHQQKSIIEHVDLLVKAFLKIIREGISTARFSKSDQTIHFSPVDRYGNDNNKPEPNRNNGLSEKTENIFKALCQRNEELAATIKKLQTDTRKMQKRIVSLEEKMCNGIYHWKIENFHLIEAEAFVTGFKELRSSAFYTDPNGYRISLRMNIEKTKEVEDVSHMPVSLFIHLMHGENDEFLPWPFYGTIELCIVDQQDKYDFCVPIIKEMSSEPHLTSFQKPIEECSSKGFGYKKFTTTGVLHKRSYLKANTLIIKAKVSPIRTSF